MTVPTCAAAGIAANVAAGSKNAVDRTSLLRRYRCVRINTAGDRRCRDQYRYNISRIRFQITPVMCRTLLDYPILQRVMSSLWIATVCALVVLLLTLSTNDAAQVRRPLSHHLTMDPLVRAYYSGKITQTSTYNWRVMNYTQTVDHFGYLTNATFQQRYLVNTDNWQGNGPIFFYCGNEAPIELFAENTGFMWDIAPDFSAMLVFAEHRYYGQSFPFDNATIAYSSPETLQYLTAAQALADFGELITFIKQSNGATNSPVIAFGGSYGGMLAAWFRMKYPFIVDGAIAASAPIWQFTNMTEPTVYAQIVTKDFTTPPSASCSLNIYNSWAALANDANLNLTNNRFVPGNCSGKFQSPDDVKNILFPWLSEAYQFMAMADYPYPATFLGPLPANPINTACAQISNSVPQTDAELINNIYIIANEFWNFTGEYPECFDMSAAGPSSLGSQNGWDYQSCTEMVMPIGTYYTLTDANVIDMFYKAEWDLSAQIKYCQNQFGVTPRVNTIRDQYGGKKLDQYTRIVFTNGDRDPWSGGGVSESFGTSIVSILISGGAHHLDLRASNVSDTASVKEARRQERAFISSWIDGYNSPSEENEASNLATKWIVLITVGGTLLTVAIAICLFTYCRTKQAETSTSTNNNLYEPMARSSQL